LNNSSNFVDVPFFGGLEASSGFSYVVPRTVFAWDFVNNIALDITGETGQT